MSLAHELLHALSTGIRILTFRRSVVSTEIAPAASQAAHGLCAIGFTASLVSLGAGTTGDMLLAGLLGIVLFVALSAVVAWSGRGKMAFILYHGAAMAGLAALTASPFVGTPIEVAMMAWTLVAWAVFLARSAALAGE